LLVVVLKENNQPWQILQKSKIGRIYENFLIYLRENFFRAHLSTHWPLFYSPPRRSRRVADGYASLWLILLFPFDKHKCDEAQSHQHRLFCRADSPSPGIHFQLNPDKALAQRQLVISDYQAFIHEITNGNWTC